MRRAFALPCVLALATACGGSRSVAGTEEPPGPAAEEAETKQEVDKARAVLHIGLELESLPSDPVTTQIDLVVTNETGANERHNLGVFDGKCKDATPAVRQTDPEVFLAFHCQPFGEQRGVLVHILHRRGRLVLLRAWLGTHKPSFDEFDQIGELPPFPTGVPLRTDYD